MANGAGTLIAGRYRLDEPVGQGGMGRVWRAYDLVLDREVAVKEVLLSAELPDAARAALVARATREARSAARLRHPGVVTIHDVAEQDGVPWIVMEFLPGQSLGAMIGSGRLLPWRQAADVGAKIADALAHAHAAGIVHRDLKPDNVLVSGDQVTVTDFGVARVADSATRLTSTGTVIGTPHYMAPEQLEGSEVEAAADMWALGATLHAAVEGSPPFNGPTLTSIVTAILAREPSPAVHAGPLAGVIGDLLRKAPGDRPAATAVSASLRALTLTEAEPAASPAAARTPTLKVTSASSAAKAGAARTSESPAVSSATMSAPIPRASLQPGTPATRAPADGPGPASAAWPARGGDGLAVAGLAFALASLALDIAALAARASSVPGKSAAAQYASDVIPLIIALVALVNGRARKPLLPYVLGSMLGSFYFLAANAIAIPVDHDLSGGRRLAVDSLAFTLDSALGVVASVLLVIALHRQTSHGRWARPRVLPGLLLAVTAAGWVVWNAASLIAEHTAFAAAGDDTFASSASPAIASFIVGLVAVLLTLPYALCIQQRPAGGTLILGWTVTAFLDFVATVTWGPLYSGAVVTFNLLAGLLMLASAVLAAVYSFRRRPAGQ